MKTVHLSDDNQKRFQVIQFRLSCKAGIFQSPQKVVDYLLTAGEAALKSSKKREK